MAIKKVCQICEQEFYVSKFNKDEPHLYVCEDCDRAYHINERWRKNGEKSKHKRA